MSDVFREKHEMLKQQIRKDALQISVVWNIKISSTLTFHGKIFAFDGQVQLVKFLQKY